ncbi:UDP-glucose 4-epimerase [Paenibacillus darwinianus]|uniref:UDP-glucose 4-epimerase n=1 Tax=Paenibacillus darwinianus TaxID=1380763 RepID=A0A9W5S088_9BACL|nr:NAD-dependent epimerase/dehydratase family protein [Paenibacillus darwinianus]EXX86299.1 UDP-glucose 4-epimerase [Paenibacillus darwinianus]EXX86390.1 UDP-glucose 4-epimerase [Paenibacillus darwinianus]EXX90999.1 UDP-glucose 4-epimerase [Paenibacillus darwinianus]
MRAVVTGGAGFIGSHLVNELVASGFEVHVIDNLSAGDVRRVHAQAALHTVDIREADARETIRSVKPDTIFHLAAQADVQRSILQPEFDADVNVMGTLNVLEAARDAGVRKIVFASTSGVYGDLQKDLLVEDDPTRPISFYGLSKLAAEHYIRLYHQFFGTAYTILRYGNVYGPGQTAKGEGGVVAVLLDQIGKGQPLSINGNGEQTRDFVYVKDVVAANLAAVRRGDGETVHIGTGSRTPVNRLAGILGNLHHSAVQVVHRPAKAGDILHSCLANDKARNLLQWKPDYDIEQGLRETYLYRFGPSPGNPH